MTRRGARGPAHNNMLKDPMFWVMVVQAGLIAAVLFLNGKMKDMRRAANVRPVVRITSGMGSNVERRMYDVSNTG